MSFTQSALSASNVQFMPQPSLTWQFENSTSEYNTNITPTTTNGIITYSSGKYGNALNLTGTASNVIYLGNIPTFPSNSGITLCFWWNPTSTLGGYILDLSSLTSGITFRDRIYIGSDGTGKLYINLQPTSGWSSSTLTNGNWYHFTVIATNTYYSTYYNGVFQQTITASFPTIDIYGTNMSIGVLVNNTGTTANGRIDDLRIYNTVLNAAQIQSIYAAQGMLNTGIKNNSSYIRNATGGDIIKTINGYKIHIFTTVGTATFTPSTSGLIDILIVGGGGGGAGNAAQSHAGGGGGAGEVYYGQKIAVSGATTVTVGGGGAGEIAISSSSWTASTAGSNSSFGSLIANGGGRGGHQAENGGSGGSGGGGGRGFPPGGTTGGLSTKTIGYGNIGGGSGSSLGSTASAGSGGGAGGPGLYSYNDSIRTPGGPGLSYSISGSSVIYAVGGNGGSRNTSANGTSASPNTGSGGNGGDGASASLTSGGNGGSGIVIISYPDIIPTFNTGIPLFNQLSPNILSYGICLFSLRAIYGITARAVQVRRSSDNATQDFYADRLGNLLTVPITGQPLSNWLGGATGYVTYWYDQSGKNNHASQGTSANQPIIQQATKGPGYSVLCNGTTNSMNITAGGLLDNTNYTIIAATRRTAAKKSSYYCGTTGNSLLNQRLHVGYEYSLALGNGSDSYKLAQYANDLQYTGLPPFSTYSAEPLRYISCMHSSTSGKRIYSSDIANYGLAANNTDTRPLISGGGVFYICQSPGQGYYQGEMYEVLVFTQSLYDIDGTNTISTIYNNQLSQYGT